MKTMINIIITIILFISIILAKGVKLADKSSNLLEQTIKRAKINLTIEAEEDIEIVRFLEMGFEVQMIEMSAESIPVDNPEDIKLVEKKLGFE